MITNIKDLKRAQKALEILRAIASMPLDEEKGFTEKAVKVVINGLKSWEESNNDSVA